MAEKWQGAFKELRQYIAANPAIEIDASSVVISGDLRPEFYRLFDTVRAGFVEERHAAELGKAYCLSEAYAAAGRAVRQEMGLEDIEVAAGLNWFLLDPTDGLMRVLFDPLFDLVKGKTDPAGFIQIADDAVSGAFKMFFREGYERWGALALLGLLAPDRLWLGKTHDFYTDPAMEGDVVEGNRSEFVPDPVESRRLVFDNLIRASFVVPGPVVHSARLNSYVSLRPGWYLPRWRARILSERLEWIDLKQLYKEFGTGDLWPDMMLHATDGRSEDLKLIADYYYLARPEVNIEFMEEDGWWDAKRVEDIVRHHLVINPRLGTYVISRVEVPPEAFNPPQTLPTAENDLTASGVSSMSGLSTTAAGAIPAPCVQPLSLAELPDNIHILSVGYDVSKLEPVIAALAEAAAHAKEVRLRELESG